MLTLYCMSLQYVHNGNTCIFCLVSSKLIFFVTATSVSCEDISKLHPCCHLVAEKNNTCQFLQSVIVGVLQSGSQVYIFLEYTQHRSQLIIFLPKLFIFKQQSCNGFLQVHFVASRFTAKPQTHEPFQTESHQIITEQM